jgi:hypothetical protein
MQIAGKMLPATKRYFARGDIRNEETSFNPLPGKDKNRTLKQFGKLTSCLFTETYTALLNHLENMYYVKTATP